LIKKSSKSHTGRFLKAYLDELSPKKAAPHELDR